MKSFKDVTDYLNSLINYEVEFPLGGSRDRPKLEPVFAAARSLDLPLVLPNCVHIAGTVGKGSTAAISQALLSVHHDVLTFTSPHLVSPKERVQRNGMDLPDDVWCRGISAIRDGMAESGIKLTYFETTFVFYLWCAKTQGTTAHVVETGLGGSFDATNVLAETTAVLTRVDLDHTHILGKTIAEIARDKSGIMKKGGRCFSVEQDNAADDEIRKAAQASGVKLYVEGADFRSEAMEPQEFTYHGGRIVDRINLPLAGDFQGHNLAVALAAVLSLDGALTDEEIRNCVSSVSIKGRQQVLKTRANVMIDVCHNPASFAELAKSLRLGFADNRRVALVAMMKDKDALESLKHFKGVVSELWVTEAPTPRTYSAQALQEIANDLDIPAKIVTRDEGYRRILELPRDVQGVICGSFYLVGDFLREYPDA